MAIDGTVALNFDFAKGSLNGAITLFLSSYSELPLGTFTFKDTTFSAGGTTYSAAFNTPGTGVNSLAGQFTGPAAQETIGSWALPFVLTTGNNEVVADGLAIRHSERSSQSADGRETAMAAVAIVLAAAAGCCLHRSAWC